MYSRSLFRGNYFIIFFLLEYFISSFVKPQQPAARASGLPYVKSYLNGINVPQVVRLKTLIAKMVGVVVSIAGGLSWGKEGYFILSFVPHNLTNILKLKKDSLCND